MFHGIRGETCQFLFPITINWGYTKLKYPSLDSVNDNTEMEFPYVECLSSVSVHDKPIIYKQSQ